jgi:hypothetical protein
VVRGFLRGGESGRRGGVDRPGRWGGRVARGESGREPGSRGVWLWLVRRYFGAREGGGGRVDHDGARDAVLAGGKG